MSGFLAGVVRRGAGMPSPVTIRPSTGPLNIPAAGTVLENEPTAERALDAPHIQPSTVESVTPLATERPQTVELVQAPVHTTRVEVSRVRPERRRDVPAQVPMTPLIKPVTETIRIIEPSQAPSERTELMPAVAALRKTVEPTPVSQAPRPIPSIAAVAPERVKEFQTKIKTGPVMAPPMKPQPAPVPAHRPTEARNIQVKIGRVEIRSTQPQQAAPAPRPAAKGGFDEITLARTYVDRGHR